MKRTIPHTKSYGTLKELTRETSFVSSPMKVSLEEPEFEEIAHNQMFVQVSTGMTKSQSYRPLEVVQDDIECDIRQENTSENEHYPTLSRQDVVIEGIADPTGSEYIANSGIRRNLCSLSNLRNCVGEFDDEKIERHTRRLKQVCGKKFDEFSAALLDGYVANKHCERIKLISSVREGLQQKLKYKLLNETYFEIVQKWRLEIGLQRFNELLFKNFRTLKRQLDPPTAESWQINGMTFVIEDVEHSTAFSNDRRKAEEVRKIVRNGLEDYYELLGQEAGQRFFDYLISIKWQNSGFRKVEWRVFEPEPCSQLLPLIRALIFFQMATIKDRDK